MKTKSWKIGVILFAALLLLSACTGNMESTEENKIQASPSQEERIAQLEAELEDLRQKELAYKLQIATLQAQVTQLSNATSSSSDPLTERVTFHYREESGGAVITGYDGNASILAIPPVLNGLPVIAIGERAFEKKTLTAITLPEGIVRIDWFAFYECTGLADITLPSTLSTIGYAVFDGCPLLTIRCPVGSYAEKYAQSYAIPYTTT